MKKFLSVSLAAILVLTCFIAVGCNFGGIAIKVFLHHYDDFDTTKIIIYDSDKDLPTPTRVGYAFGGWYLDDDGNEAFVPHTEMTRSFHLYAKWEPQTLVGSHTEHVFDSYFMYGECSYSDCNVVSRAKGNRIYDNMYNYTKSKGEEISSHYNDCVAALNGTLSRFVEAFDVYSQDLDYLDGQYYWATLYYDVRNMSYDTIATVYDTHFANYYGLFIDADERFGDEFWEACGEDREETLYWAEIYSGADDFGVNDALQAYENAMSGYRAPTTERLNTLYKNLVTAYNKEAAHYGYDNYIEYAYKEVYNREYDPSQTAQMRAYVKQYIAPALATVSDKLDRLTVSGASKTLYNTLMSGSIVSSSPNKDAVNYIGNYFKWLTNSNADKPIDFYTAVNEMFCNGNYFTGSGEGAYTMWIPNDNMATVYVQKSSDYDNAFTFVHEFGHYYESYHNGGLALSYDHEETHSQGNEMLFLAWLKENTSAAVRNGMTMVELEQLYNMLWTVCMSSAVDELEQAAYTGSYNGKTVTGGYHALFGEILDTYGTAADILQNDNDYWYYVAFDNAVYYISYAMSALPSVELYTLAESEGLQTARDTYFKLFTYCEDTVRMATYTYSDVLEFCGLDSPFDIALYQQISNYVNQL